MKRLLFLIDMLICSEKRSRIVKEKMWLEEEINHIEKELETLPKERMMTLIVSVHFQK